ncbi:nuclear transport factor 2 family protein [Roseomonas marmotae]|uniref:Nuclear transport factor 2 family protein n=1 Tax=Roseomonas marmotae TaxID=2768161 RepID=A0ABS3K7H8_9PROT|nr:nuclear transport factor 2 family protein [Roseomonas marmotae]MBO1073407.1 nuclear transport factor 2 family protein [Roseomonas marmotae]QTI80395.1 nuclear transport factor 2 family protein [Roseomonas marmotae]
MTPDLPEPIASYFAADSQDAAAVARCFKEDAVVVDERQTHVGRDAIGRWKAEASTRYSYVSEPIAAEEVGGRMIVTSRVTGNFPGSPADLRYIFHLEGAAIARLEIVS